MALTDKKYDKIVKELGKEFMEELDKLDPSALKSKIASAESAINTAADELEANHKYQDAKAVVDAARGGLRDVKKRQTSLKLYCLHLLEEQGEEL